MIEEEMEMMGPKPTCFDTLPFQLFRLTKYLLFAIPAIPGAVKAMYQEQQRIKEEKIREEKELEEERKWREEEKEKRKEAKATKRKNANKYREKAEDTDSCQVSSGEPSEQAQAKRQPKNALSMWTDDDLVTLAKFIKKYPGGSADRWEQIADSMERFSWEVTKMAAKIKKNPNLVPISMAGQGVTGREDSRIISDSVLEVETNREEEDEGSETEEDSQDSEDDGFVMYSVAGKEDYVPVEVKKKQKTKGGRGGDNEEENPDANDWSQEQQKCLELALSQFPKGTSERWDRIAGKVNGKTKEQCMARFKHLAEMIKKKKEEAAQ